MAVKKPKKKPVIRRSSSAIANGRRLSYHDSIHLRLSAVRGVEAVYTWVGIDKIVHVVSVVQDYDSAIYDWLIPKENLVERDHPRIAFDFHVCARQKRKVDDVVPPSAYLVFKK